MLSAGKVQMCASVAPAAAHGAGSSSSSISSRARTRVNGLADFATCATIALCTRGSGGMIHESTKSASVPICCAVVDSTVDGADAAAGAACLGACAGSFARSCA